MVGRAEELNAKTIITHSDNEISSGNTFSRNGFSRIGNVEPVFKYLFKNIRISRSSLMNREICESLKLRYDESMGDIALAELNNLTRVWDSGKVRWELNV